MNRARLYGTKATGFLSALFLYLAAAVAGAYGPLAAEATSAASQSRTATGGMDARDPRSAPAGHLRQSVSFDNRELDPATPQGNGNAKALPPPTASALPETVADNASSATAAALRHSAPPHGYSARAPPALI
ncbi:hypothetical protein RB623_06055 [Mesorhizobium sp. LHD-90]|uniref:hypothetical protein n=1 Tax=Mesorhizobium sp. LHD-90 TaxID=3071414 RepID=UPI0027DEDABD|nr:hypothetical protein [Mesorhizobium sp. LHD-90]MDQ6433613.1 hypothetical protein [Mesorhizobium sp. LHD-90]